VKAPKRRTGLAFSICRRWDREPSRKPPRPGLAGLAVIAGNTVVADPQSHDRDGRTAAGALRHRFWLSDAGLGKMVVSRAKIFSDRDGRIPATGWLGAHLMKVLRQRLGDGRSVSMASAVGG